MPRPPIAPCLPALLWGALVAGLPAQGGEGPAAWREHWAWRPPARPPVPDARDPGGWAAGPVDRFVLARLEAAGLEPAAAAAGEELIRRAAFDLLGVPPGPDDVDGFLADESPDAWARLLDRLLASPGYGERQGRRWLDLVRFAESNGFEHDEVRPDAWRYRDYVIDAFNADTPYDRFVEEQLAGDLLFPSDLAASIATGYALLGPDMTDAADQAERRQHTLADMTDATALVFLGLTLGCARCHDHKLEPLTQRDYYGFQAFFSPSEFRKDIPLATPEEIAAHGEAERRWKAARDDVSAAIERVEAPARARLRAAKLERLEADARAAHETPPGQRTAAQKELVRRTESALNPADAEIRALLDAGAEKERQELVRQGKRLDAERPSPLPVASGLGPRKGEGTKTFILERGEIECPTDPVDPGVPAIVAGAAPPLGGAEARADAASDPLPATRADLARWIASARNPLAPRVIVNRLWQGLFGRGIVASPSDFGLEGDRPTHPELLDWLAIELPGLGWSLKALQRRLLLSAAYRQASRASEEALRRDPGNFLLSRQRRKRLEAEEVRDALLAASGLLDRTQGGPSVFPPLPAGAAEGSRAWRPAASGRGRLRRSIYIFQRRSLRFPLLELFDLPDSGMSCARRLESTTASQSLALFNGDATLEAASALAKRVAAGGGGMHDQVEGAFLRVLGRRPAPGEAAAALELVEAESLETLCRALFNVNEFLFVE